MSDLDLDEIEHLVDLLENHNLNYSIVYDATANILAFYPDIKNNHNINVEDYYFLELNINRKDMTDKELLKNLRNIVLNSENPRSIIDYCVKLKHFTSDYKYNSSNITEYVKVVNSLKRNNNLIQHIDEEIKKYECLQDRDQYAAEYLCELGMPIKSEDKNNAKITDVKIVEKDNLNNLKFGFWGSLVMSLLFFVVVLFSLNSTVGGSALVFSALSAVACSVFYKELKSKDYTFPNIFKKKNNKNVIQKNTQKFVDYYPKPTNEIEMLKGDTRFEKIVEVGRKYFHFSDNDKRNYITCVKELTSALEISKNNISYVNNDQKDELINEILITVNKVMDNIAHNVNNQTNDDLTVINNFIKDACLIQNNSI